MSAPMTAERLAEIREGLKYTDYDDHPEAHDLLDEVDRLRTGIEALIDAHRYRWMDVSHLLEGLLDPTEEYMWWRKWWPERGVRRAR